MKRNNLAYQIFARYIILLLLGLGNLIVFYKIFTPLTIYPTSYLLSLFYDINLVGVSLIIGNYTIEIVEACIAPAAYYLLLIFNLSTPINAKRRFFSILFSFVALLILNIIRISALSAMFVSGNSAFDLTHKALWYGLSTVFVIGIWFLTVYVYKIKEIPFYSDYLFFKKLIQRPASHRR